MKLKERTGRVEMSEDIGEVSEFTIRAGRKAFEILSSGLYSDKIRAVIRELSTNAFDSHVQAGTTDIPFEVHLPTVFDSVFYVRDYGTGMTEEVIKKLYTTYFGSSRSGSDDFTGALGLGSKSPFAYADSFTVESYVDGKMQMWTCFKSEQGVPAITKMAEGDTQEKNGVKVSVLVKHTDLTEFRLKAQDVLSWFNPQPKVTNCANFAFDKRDYSHKFDDFGLHRSGTGRSRIVMGNVAYPVTSSNLGPNCPDNVSQIVNYGVDLFVPVGKCDIAANREELGWDKPTVKYVLEVLDKVAQKLTEETGKLWDDCKTYYDACSKYAALQYNFLVKMAKRPIMWQGKALTDHVYFRDFADAPWIERCIRGRTDHTISHSILENFSFTYHYENNKPKIFIKDIDTGVYSKITYWLQQERAKNNGYPQCLLIHPGKTYAEQSRYKVGQRKWCEADLFAGMGENVSTLPDPPENSPIRQRTKRHTTLLRHYKMAESAGRPSLPHGDPSQFWENVKKDVSEGGVYTELFRYTMRTNFAGATNLPPDRLFTFFKNCGSLLGNKLPDIYGVRPADVERLKKLKNWKTLGKWIEEKYEHHKDKYTTVAIDRRVAQVAHQAMKFQRVAKHRFAAKGPMGLLQEQLDILHKAQDSERAGQFICLQDAVSAPVKPLVEARLNEINGLVEKCHEAYPLLRAVNIGYIGDEHLPAIANYVQLTDAEAGLK